MYEAYYPELLATFTGRLLADICMFPLETVLHRLLLQGTRTIIDNTDNGLGVVPIITRYEGMIDCYRSVIIEEGLPALYKGFGALTLQFTMHMMILKVTKYLFEFLSQDSANQAKRQAVALEQQRILEQMKQHPQQPGPSGALPAQQQQQQYQQQQQQQELLQQHNKHVTFQTNPNIRW